MMDTPKLTPEAKRLRIVYEECKAAGLVRNSSEFAEVLGIDQGSYSKMSNGIYPVNFLVVKNICYKLGYSPAWFINGEGRRKTDKEDVKLVTEVSMLRSEIDIIKNLYLKLQARMAGYEKESV